MSQTNNETMDQTKPKKKGRPKSEHYVKESELRDEIAKSKENKIEALQEIESDYDKRISALSTEPEKQALREEKENALNKANIKTYCTKRLGEIVVLTVDRVSTQGKYRDYTYLDEMKAEAIFQSIRGIIKFDLYKINSAGQKSSSFSYLTQIINNAFRQILKKEKRNREIKDKAIDSAIDEHGDIDVDFESIKKKRDKMDSGD